MSDNQTESVAVSSAVLAAFLGWTVDAFDFFVVIFLLDVLAHQFAVSKPDVVRTLMSRWPCGPVGALLFGILADRYGGRTSLMLNVLYFSLIEVLRRCPELQASE
jgi:SHS family lactate transporter-like MFS transporter